MAITEPTRKALWATAKNRCAFPGCKQSLIQMVASTHSPNPHHVTVGEEAHICARSDNGPRFDPKLTPQERDAYDNLILLCPNHHTMIDANDGAGYTVHDLREMKRMHLESSSLDSELKEKIFSYLGQRYTTEGQIQFQQVDLNGPSVESMFVDVPVGCKNDGSATARLIHKISRDEPGDNNGVTATTNLVVTGATQLLMHPSWSGHAVLVGGPGQGKSTVLQYLCQSYRAQILGKGEPTEQSASEESPISKPPRIPIKVDLRKYALWAANELRSKSQQNKKSRKSMRPESSGWGSLEQYIVCDFKNSLGGRDFSFQDFASILANESVLLALDGLDEVASLHMRSRVTDEIANVQGRLGPNALDLVILVATRPGTSLQPLLSSKEFTLLHLQRLTHGLRLQYLQKWVSVSRLSEDAGVRLQNTFLDNQTVPHVEELAAYPMQLAILLHLLYRRQLLPQQRTHLYAEYLKTFLDREQTEDKEPLLAKERRLIEDSHAYIGWHIQTKAEEGESSGSISREELRGLLREHLADRRDDQKIVDKIYSAITDRVLCLVERDGGFEFEVQSLREYFAALYMFDNLSLRDKGNSRDDALNILIERPYWLNVCRFFVGMLSKGEIRALHENLSHVESRVTPSSIVRSTAATLLRDRIYEGHSMATIRRVIDIILQGPGIVLSEDGILSDSGLPLRFTADAGLVEARAHLKMRLETEDEACLRGAAADALAELSESDIEYREWWWGKYEPSTMWLETASRLHILENVSRHEEEQLLELARCFHSTELWLSTLLLRGGFRGANKELLGMIRADLNDGAIDDNRLQGMWENRSELIAAARHAQASVQWSALGDLLPSIPAHAAPSSQKLTSSTGGLQILDSLRALLKDWGDGWIFDRSLSHASLPSEADHVYRDLRDAFPPATTALEFALAARTHQGDLDWWKGHFRSCDSGRTRMRAAIAFLEIAHSKTFVGLANEFEEFLSTLEPREFRIVEAILIEDSERLRVRRLDLNDALRLRSISLSGRALWLALVIGTDSTRSRITPLLPAAIRDIVAAGSAESRRILESIEPKRKIEPSAFLGARGVFRGARNAGDFPHRKLSASMQSTIARQPEKWPSNMVRTALDAFDERRASQQSTLGEVSRKYKWFS